MTTTYLHVCSVDVGVFAAAVPACGVTRCGKRASCTTSAAAAMGKRCKNRKSQQKKQPKNTKKKSTPAAISKGNREECVGGMVVGQTSEGGDSALGVVLRREIVIFWEVA